jgi:hypothetical protein
MLWYGNRIEDFFQFDYFGDNTSKNLDFVRTVITKKPQLKKTTPDLYAAFKNLYDFYKGNKYYHDVRKRNLIIITTFLGLLRRLYKRSAKPGHSQFR